MDCSQHQVSVPGMEAKRIVRNQPLEGGGVAGLQVRLGSSGSEWKEKYGSRHVGKWLEGYRH
jgi:hypothetical protein